DSVQIFGGISLPRVAGGERTSESQIIKALTGASSHQRREPKCRAAVFGLRGIKSGGRLVAMTGKRVQFHEETWRELRILASESMMSFQELADEAFNDLLKKHGRPTSLKDALRKSAADTAKVIPLRHKRRAAKKGK